VRETIKQGEGDGPMDAATKGGEMRPGRRPGGAAVGFCAPRSPSGRRSFPLLSLVLLALLVLLFPGATAAQYLLVPMDRSQANHLRAYGLTYSVLEGGEEGEWLLNYRGGSFLLPDRERVRREAALRGVSFQPVDGGEVARIRGIIQNGNMDAVPLETAPRIAVYTPPNTPPWDDAVTLALEYAGIPYATVWDGDVLEGRLSEYDWLHLHHEDFTGQYSKFFLTYSGTSWLQEEVARNQEMARRFGYPNVPALKRAVAETIRSYVLEGGFLFAMCSATETLDLALASHRTDIAASFANGRPPDPDATERMDWSRALAFQGASVQTSPTVSAFSDIDTHQVNTPWRQPLSSFTLFEFSAKIDPVASMLVQNHEAVLRDFYGLTTAFREDRLKPGATILARDRERVKYVTGTAGQGTWTFFGGHDPEDPEHKIGDAPTNLDLHPSSPGYRLILNNVLFPAARPRPLRTQ
jgi:hypothetical protein